MAIKRGAKKKPENERIVRLNISVAADVAIMLKQLPNINVSRICTQALRSACLQEWAKLEQTKLLIGL